MGGETYIKFFDYVLPLKSLFNEENQHEHVT